MAMQIWAIFGSGNNVCLTALSHYLSQCWHIIKKVQWHSPEGNFTRDTSNNSHQVCLENHFLEMSLKSPRGQWVMPVSHLLYKCSTQCLLCVYINFKSLIERLFGLIPRPTSRPHATSSTCIYLTFKGPGLLQWLQFVIATVFFVANHNAYIGN